MSTDLLFSHSFIQTVSCEYAGKRLHTKVNGEPFEKARADLFKAFRKEGLNLQVPNLSIRTKGLDDE